MKLNEYDLGNNVPQELVDFKDDVVTLINYGKYQSSVVSGVPTWRGRKGESVYLMNGTTGILYVCTTDNATTWKVVSTFSLS